MFIDGTEPHVSLSDFHLFFQSSPLLLKAPQRQAPPFQLCPSINYHLPTCSTTNAIGRRPTSSPSSTQLSSDTISRRHSKPSTHASPSSRNRQRFSSLKRWLRRGGNAIIRPRRARKSSTPSARPTSAIPTTARRCSVCCPPPSARSSRSARTTPAVYTASSRTPPLPAASRYPPGRPPLSRASSAVDSDAGLSVLTGQRKKELTTGELWRCGYLEVVRMVELQA